SVPYGPSAPPVTESLHSSGAAGARAYRRRGPRRSLSPKVVKFAVLPSPFLPASHHVRHPPRHPLRADRSLPARRPLRLENRSPARLAFGSCVHAPSRDGRNPLADCVVARRFRRSAALLGGVGAVPAATG